MRGRETRTFQTNKVVESQIAELRVLLAERKDRAKPVSCSEAIRWAVAEARDLLAEAANSK